MKKVLFLAMLLCSVLFLSSCEVHYFGSNYDVPWYIIAIPAALFSFDVLFIAHISIIKKYYKCPKCGTEFMASNKFPYEEPTVQVIKLTAEDILAESGGEWKDPAELEEIPD